MEFGTHVLELVLAQAHTKTMHFYVSQFVSNFTILLQCLQVISPYLKGPTLVYHDGSDNADIIAKTLFASHEVVIARIPEQPYNDHLYTTQSAILLGESPEPMANILRMWPLWNARGRVVVFLNNPTDVHEWITVLWKKTRAADILAVVLSEPPQFFTWFPYKPDECSNVTTVVQINSSNPFPEKLTPPYNNCPLMAVTSELKPFVVNNTHGSELRMFRDLAKKLGMLPIFAELLEHQNVWTSFDENNQPSSGFKLLFENQVDMMFSALTMSSQTTPYTDFMMPHTSEEFVLFVPGPLQALRTTAIIRAFNPQAWTLVIIASFIIYAAVVLILWLETGKLQPAFIHTVAIVLNASTNFPHSKALLLFAVAAYMYSLHITTAFTASFIVFLSDIPHEEPMTTLEDVVVSGLKMQVHISLQSEINTISTNPSMQAMNQPNRAIFVPRLNLAMVGDRENVLVGPKTPFQAYVREDSLFYDKFDYPRVLMIKKPLFYTFLTFYISKGHPLYHQLNSNFLRLLEGGFPEHYLREVDKPRRPKQRNLEPFGLKNVEGPFFLHLSLLGACILAWVGEWVHFWVKKLKSWIMLQVFF